MTNNKKYDIYERIFRFIVEVIKFVQSLPRTPVNLAIIDQIIPSVTSMGANDQEADGASSNKEFVHKFGIVRKEGKETNFWLRLIVAISLERKDKANELKKEGDEIVAIVSKIISNANKKRVQKRK